MLYLRIRSEAYWAAVNLLGLSVVKSIELCNRCQKNVKAKIAHTIGIVRIKCIEESHTMNHKLEFEINKQMIRTISQLESNTR